MVHRHLKTGSLTTDIFFAEVGIAVILSAGDVQDVDHHVTKGSSKSQGGIQCVNASTKCHFTIVYIHMSKI